ncbi:hypothetical protein P9A14_15065 [Gordonia hongkongensis]|uniref:Uncharacterized protein n=1 Tax=Gordonia hongkongensis TaxID=1701090 RepID=A0AAX3T2V8_9ACTN|nr:MULTISPECIES: hypothetical protein [Gordonia]OCW85415.1 hypothetical protein A8M60_05955 [Nocardia farcinica]QIK47483.1 hypothetical protein G8C36_09685 [Gordonia terrae]MBN0971541.1 hypothetical protein [Gordonia sp. BP-119]MBN0981325.1 hypothetical protein [Gordonia sp. BP-94]MBR7192838.1 hypothetical protein [Gordonia sp. SCSIO 19800]
MGTLLTSDEFEIRLLFAESVPEVMQFVRDVVRQREPIALELEGSAHIVNLANVRHFSLVDETDDVVADSDERTTVVLSIAEAKE